MAILQLDVRTQGRYAQRISVELQGLSIALRFRWLPRISRWALRVEDPDGLQLSPESIVQPQGLVALDRSAPTCPPGDLLWVGPDDYVRTDMGEALRLLYREAL